MCRDRQELPLGGDEIGKEGDKGYGVRPIQRASIREEGDLERVSNEGGGPDSRDYNGGDLRGHGYDLKGSGAGWVTGWGWMD